MRPESVCEYRARDGRLRLVRLHLDKDEVVELLELLRLRFLDGDVPVLHEVGRVDEGDGLLARTSRKPLMAAMVKG